MHSGFRKNASTEGHGFAARGFFVDGIYQLDPKKPNHKTGRVVSKSDKYLIK